MAGKASGAFASKGSAGRRHPRWWIVVLAAVMTVALVAGVSARAEAAGVEWTPYSENDPVDRRRLRLSDRRRRHL